MDLILYSLIFWVAAIVFTGLEVREKTGNVITTIIKVIPALTAVVFVFSSIPSPSLFYPLLLIALVFCGLGDVAMEYNILPGLGMFLFGHIVFIINFVMHSTVGVDIIPIAVFFICVAMMLVYILLFHRYLLTAEEPTKMIKAVDVYALAISFTFCTSILLWLSTATLFGFFPIIGVLFFIASDSMIGIREFHHRFRFDEPATMITYYLAIFLISLAAIIYIV
ncbi:MAG: lysoplasmalogenase family protein [Candidatus Thorarchaeota archaeon]